MHRTVADLEAWGRRKASHLQSARRQQQQLRAQAETAGVTFRPEINERSRKLATEAAAAADIELSRSVGPGETAIRAAPLSFPLQYSTLLSRGPPGGGSQVSGGRGGGQRSRAGSAPPSRSRGPHAASASASPLPRNRGGGGGGPASPGGYSSPRRRTGTQGGTGDAPVLSPMQHALEQLRSVREALADGWLSPLEAQAYTEQYMQVRF